MANIFTKHPEEVGETYIVHLKFALIFSAKLFLASLASLIHAIFPFLLQKTASQILFNQIQQFIARTPSTDPRLIELLEQLKQKTNCGA